MKKVARFPPEQIVKIQDRFDEFASKGRMTLLQFKKSMGLLGIGEGESICERIFSLITKARSEKSPANSSSKEASFGEFIDFLDTITYGSKEQKAEVSFNFLDRGNKGFISNDDIEVIISEISFLWYYLTGEQISNSSAIEFISAKLGIDDKVEIGLSEYVASYDQQFNWFEYFNHKLMNPTAKEVLLKEGASKNDSRISFLSNLVSEKSMEDPELPSSSPKQKSHSTHKGEEQALSLLKKDKNKESGSQVGGQRSDFPIDQVEEYLKAFKSQLQKMIGELKDETDQEFDVDEESKSMIWELSAIKGPTSFSSPEIKPKGDSGIERSKFKAKDKVYSQTELELSIGSSVDLSLNGNHSCSHSILERLRALEQLQEKLFKGKLELSLGKNQEHAFSQNLGLVNTVLGSDRANRRMSRNRLSFVNSEEEKRTVINKTEPVGGKRVNIVYFGHESWNLMLNMMLGIRKSLKEHYFVYSREASFTEEDLNCKYTHELIYKRNNRSAKEISEVFVDYSPKVFFYLRQWFGIDNQGYLRSIGLENLVGSLLLGNLSTLTDQTSEGKSGSFMYYTQDSKLIVKSISRDQYKKLREILNDYLHYLRLNRQTFLVKIYGLYKLKNKASNRQIYFIVINNVFNKGIQIKERYDIKGSTYNRQVIDSQMAELSMSRCSRQNVALKDLDLINRQQKRSFDIKSQRKSKIYNQIISDASFLSKHNIIEYSLLIGIGYANENEASLSPPISPNRQSKEGRVSLQREDADRDRDQEIWNAELTQQYFFGLIDILSEYSVGKMLENHFFHGIGKDISCLAPEEYFKRFQNFIHKHIFSS